MHYIRSFSYVARIILHGVKHTLMVVAGVSVVFLLLCPESALAEEARGGVKTGSDNQGKTVDSLSNTSSGVDSALQHGLEAYRKGDFTTAVTAFTEAAFQAEQEADSGKRLDSLLYLSDAYQSLGLTYKQMETLFLAGSLPGETDAGRLAALHARFASAYLSVGKHEKARKSLDAGIEAARSSGREGLLAALWNEYGNLHIARTVRCNEQEKEASILGHRGMLQNVQTGDLRGGLRRSASRGVKIISDECRGMSTSAIESFQKSKELAAQTGNYLLASRAGLNLLRARIERDDKIDEKSLNALVDEALDFTNRLEETYQKAENYLSIGDLLRTAQLKYGLPATWRKNAYDVLLEALDLARKLNNDRAASYALGYLGMLYIDEGRYEESRSYTQRAIYSAQRADAQESLYRWEWQNARLLRAQGKTEEAILAYREAINTLKNIRSSLIGTGRGTFRQLVGPVFFEFADLLLTRKATLKDIDAIQKTLMEVRTTMERVKVAEIEDYFEHECVLPPEQTTRLDQIEASSAVVYPVLLSERTELLVHFPDGLQQFTTHIGFQELSEEVHKFRLNIEKQEKSEAYLESAKNLYNWLIAPLDGELKRQNITTLVFIPDGPLRSIPISALHDGKKFLIETYAIATTISLDLTNPRQLEREDVDVLLNGLTKAVQNHGPLPYVGTELENVNRLFPSKMLKDEGFRLAAAENEMSGGAYSIVHMATHGHFDRDHRKSYLLTFDDKLTMDRLEQTVGVRRYQEEPLELLVLSACETAAGDERAALGLAGIALKAGARSALATLWSVNDMATSELVSEFYRQIKENKEISKAKALQNAQVMLIREKGYTHPNLWAPFLLIGNWL